MTSYKTHLRPVGEEAATNRTLCGLDLVQPSKHGLHQLPIADHSIDEVSCTNCLTLLYKDDLSRG